MSLPAGVVQLGTFKGGKGDTGSLAFVIAESVPASEPASAEMTGPESNRGAIIRVPRGLPSLGAESDDETVATYVAGRDTQTFAALVAAFSRRVSRDVREDGAVGNGLADDTAAIRAAVAFVSAAGGGDVTFPAGTFIITGEILIPSRVSVYGRGRATIINATALPADAAAVRIGGTTEAGGVTLDGFDIVGNVAHNADGLYIGNRTGVVAVSDFTVRNVRIRDFRIGAVARYAWDGVFVNVRMHLTNRPLVWGPQVNSIQFTGAFSAFSEGATFSNCETVQFDRLDMVNFSGTGYALNLFQSNITINTPYFENLARMAQVGGATEVTKSSLTIRGGRVTGDILLAGVDVGLDVTMPWVVERGVESDTRRLTVSNPVLLSAATRRIRVGIDQSSAIGVKTLTRWRGTTAFPYPSAYGGAGITSTAKDGYYEVVSPSAAQGFTISSALEIGKQYVLSYRMRKTGGGVSIRAGGGSTAPLPVVVDATRDFEVLHIPFLATETTLRVLFNGPADVQYISLVEGLRFNDLA